MFKLLQVQIYFMMITNKWEIPTKSKLVKQLHKIYGIVSEFCCYLFSQYIGINLLFGHNCPSVFYEVSGYYLQHSNTLLMHIFLRKTAMKKSIQYIMDYEKEGYHKENQSSKAIYDYHAKITSAIHKYIMVLLTTLSCMFWYSLTVVHAVKANNDECRLVPGALYQIWYPFDGWWVILADLSMASILASMHMANRMYPVSLVIFQLTQIKILSNKIQNVDARAKEIMKSDAMVFDEAVDVAVNECVRKHQEVISLMSLFRDATREMMLIGFFSNAVELAGFIIQIFTANSPYQLLRVFLLFPTDVLQILVFFWFANEIFTESTALADDIYNNLDWVSYNGPLRKKLIIMIMRAQIPLYFEGIGVGEMTIEKFKNIMKSCFSLVTFFQTMYEK